jgi:uncharacterized membrane protein
MNTVFKLYYQAWIFLAVGGGFALYYMLTHWLPSKTVLLSWRAAWGGAALVLLAAGLAYPVGATLARTDQFGLPRHIDGLAFAKQQAGGDYQIAEWLSNNANPSDVIAEMVGNDSIGYEWGSTGRISSWTGLSTVYAWPGHEVQWRGGDKLTAGRLEDVNTLYASENAADAQRIVDKYGIDYIVVGSLERQAYSQAALEKFDNMYPKVYPPAGSQSNVAIYQVSR